MGGIIGQIFSKSTEGLLNGVNNIIDNVVTNKEEKQQVKNELTQILTDANKTQEIELTERLKSDMLSDSWLSKNIRPLSLVFTTTLITLISLTDGNLGGFTIDKVYIDLFKTLLTVQYSFYFGSRALEKTIQHFNRFK
ncbi:MAG: hypothetical protein JXR60_11580 [Bacteroidales bacterium]|nr:hypothetical protein [Bacteroidales bacterium]